MKTNNFVYRAQWGSILTGMMVWVVFITVAGCGGKPQLQIDAANDAMKAAQTAEANTYLATEYTALNDSLNSVLIEITAQDAKTFKRYGPYIATLTEITNRANDLADKAKLKKEEVKKEAQNLLDGAKVLGKDNEELMKKLTRQEKKAVDFEKTGGEQVSVMSSINEAQSAFDKGSFMEAYDKAKAADQKLKDINNRLKEVKKK